MLDKRTDVSSSMRRIMAVLRRGNTDGPPETGGDLSVLTKTFNLLICIQLQAGLMTCFVSLKQLPLDSPSAITDISWSLFYTLLAVTPQVLLFYHCFAALLLLSFVVSGAEVALFL